MARYLGYVDFQGIALGVATILLVAYVVPYLYRRRMVLAEARIEERYAEDLRILEVPESGQKQAIAHRKGPHGTVFFRQPEVIMSQSDKAQFNKAAAAQSARSNEVRALAKERARRRARISKRQVNRQRGMLGAGLLVGLCIVLWVLVGITSLSAIVAGVVTGVSVVYLACFGYIINTMATATAQDEEAIEKINQRLKSSKGSGRLSQSRRPSAPKGMNRPLDRAETEKSARPGSVAAGDGVAIGDAGVTTGDAGVAGDVRDETRVSGNGYRGQGGGDRAAGNGYPGQSDSNRTQGDGYRGQGNGYEADGIDRAGAARVEELLGSEAEKASQVRVNAQWPRPEGLLADAEGVSGEERQSGLVMSLSPEVIEDSINVDVISSVSAERVKADGVSAGKGSASAAASSDSAEVGAGRGDANIERNGEAVDSDAGSLSQDAFWEFSVEENEVVVSPVAVSPAAALSPEVASPVLAQPVIADPYAVDPYAATSTKSTDGSRVVDSGAVADEELPSYTAKPRAIERRVVTPYEAPAEPEAAVPYRPKEIGERFDNEAEGGDSSGNADGLLGGSSLDALLDRRRA